MRLLIKALCRFFGILVCLLFLFIAFSIVSQMTFRYLSQEAQEKRYEEKLMDAEQAFLETRIFPPWLSFNDRQYLISRLYVYANSGLRVHETGAGDVKKSLQILLSLMNKENANSELSVFIGNSFLTRYWYYSKGFNFNYYLLERDAQELKRRDDELASLGITKETLYEIYVRFRSEAAKGGKKWALKELGLEAYYKNDFITAFHYWKQCGLTYEFTILCYEFGLGVDKSPNYAKWLKFLCGFTGTNLEDYQKLIIEFVPNDGRKRALKN